MRIGIIGLGLIGGSFAMALRAAPGSEASAAGERIWAVDRDPTTCEDALEAGVIDEAFADADQAPLEHTDLVMLCLHPQACVDVLRRIAPRLKRGAVVSDVCGIKRPIAACAREVLPEGVAFVGGHPMAGKEQGGFAHASPTLFQRAHYLLCPGDAPSEAVALLRTLVRRIGCQDAILTDPETHDANIAYTSQMMHVLALAICEQAPFEGSKGYEGGSFRGATRVAALDAALWTQLFWDNRDALAAVVEELEGKLGEYRALLNGNDRDALARRLRETSARKEAANRAQRENHPER